MLQYSVSDEGGILTNIIWAVQMPGFMMISGYFVAKRSTDLGTGIKKSAIHYLMPFLSWYVLISVLLLGDKNFGKGLNALIHHVDVGMWFLWVIFVLSIIATFCNAALTKKSAIHFLLSIIIGFGILGGIVVATRDINFLGVKFILYYSIFYGFGWLLKWTKKYWKPIWPRIKNWLYIISVIIFAAIVYNVDLYHIEDNVTGIALRCTAGFAGCFLIYAVVERYSRALQKAKIAAIGRYTLEIYVTHMYVNGLFTKSNGNIFWTAAGFGNFTVSLICTVAFTAIIIAVIKSVPAANFVLYGKQK